MKNFLNLWYNLFLCGDQTLYTTNIKRHTSFVLSYLLHLTSAYEALRPVLLTTYYILSNKVYENKPYTCITKI